VEHPQDDRRGTCGQADARERVSQAEAVGRQAQEASSLANERAKALELEAENAKLETEQLKAKLAWRILTPPQHQALFASLSQHTGAATIAHVANDPESLYLAIQIANIFSEAK
jgi:hypothetical protein